LVSVDRQRVRADNAGPPGGAACPILVSGSVLGAALAISILVAPCWQSPWFTVSLGVVVGIMMVCYVAVPSRLIGVKKTQSRRDKLWTSALAGALGAMVTAPPYVLGRVAILMLGSKVLFTRGSSCSVSASPFTRGRPARSGRSR
jgi:hypothetical protein